MRRYAGTPGIYGMDDAGVDGQICRETEIRRVDGEKSNMLRKGRGRCRLSEGGWWMQAVYTQTCELDYCRRAATKTDSAKSQPFDEEIDEAAPSKGLGVSCGGI
jgi:hypothetical protein